MTPKKGTLRRLVRTLALAAFVAGIAPALTACETRGFGNSDGGGVRSGGLFRF